MTQRMTAGCGMAEHRCRTGDAKVANHKVLVLAGLGNPLATNWVHGLETIGCTVAVVNWRQQPTTSAELVRWGFSANAPITQAYGHLTVHTTRRIVTILDGEPDLLFGWWGSPILPAIVEAKKVFRKAKALLCVDTLPNASTLVTEIRELGRFLATDHLIDAYVFYSSAIRKHFERVVPRSRGKPAIQMIEPFLESAFADELSFREVNVLTRFDDRPHIIFTGRAYKLWTSDPRFKKRRPWSVSRFLGESRRAHICLSASRPTRERFSPSLP